MENKKDLNLADMTPKKERITRDLNLADMTPKKEGITVDAMLPGDTPIREKKVSKFPTTKNVGDIVRTDFR